MLDIFQRGGQPSFGQNAFAQPPMQTTQPFGQQPVTDSPFSGLSGGQVDIFSILQQLLGGKGQGGFQSGPKQNPFQPPEKIGGGFTGNPMLGGPSGSLDVQPRTPFGGTPISSLGAGNDFNMVNPFGNLINQRFAR